MENQKLIGFKLLKKYPNCNKPVGYFEKSTTNEFLNFPDVWQPVYEFGKENVYEINIYEGEKYERLAILKAGYLSSENKTFETENYFELILIKEFTNKGVIIYEYKKLNKNKLKI